MVYAALLLGLLGSLHCVGMCGPIAFMLPVDHSNPYKKLGQTSIYHFGRLLAYGMLGGLFGLLGKGLYVFGMQQWLSIAIGSLMLVIVLLPKKIQSQNRFTKPLYRIIGTVKSRMGKEFAKKTPDTFLTIGFLNGFLPCGLVYMAVMGSIAMASPWEGALYMVLFGVGTLPLMTAAVYLGGFLKASGRNTIRKMVPYFIGLVALLFILRGLGLGIPYLSPPPVHMAENAMECIP